MPLEPRVMPSTPKDPFLPVLTSSVPLAVTTEQLSLISQVIDRAASDTRFAEKAKIAISKILTQNPISVPVLSSINPTSAVSGTTISLVCTGTGFTPTSVIYANGNALATQYISPSEVRIDGVDLAGVAAGPVQVIVRDSVTGLTTEAKVLAITAA